MKSEESRKNPSSNNTSPNWKKMVSKKWFFPAVYLSVTVLTLSVAWWYQAQQLEQVANNLMSTDELSDSTMLDNHMILPVAQDSEADRKIGFYDDSASISEKQSALVKYANTYWPHTGWDFSRKDGKSFDVVAILSGKVVRINENPIIGRQVEIQHKNGTVSVYQSLDEIQVKKGQSIQQGFVIGKASRNSFEKNLENHLHFEIHKDHTAQNPERYFSKN